MGLLSALKLPPPDKARGRPGMIDVNMPTADPRAVDRAKRKADRRGRHQQTVLKAAIDMAEEPDAIDNVAADRYAKEPGNPAPVSKVAPRSMYDPVNPRLLEENESYGSVSTGLDMEALGAHGKQSRNRFKVKALVGQRRIVPSSIGNGEIVSAAKGVLHKQREGQIVTMAEQHVLEHEHLHVAAAARLAHALETFVNAAFATARLDDDELRRLQELLLVINDNAKAHVGNRLHELIEPKGVRDRADAEVRTRRLLTDGSVERIVRTALLDEIRLHSRALAKFRR